MTCWCSFDSLIHFLVVGQGTVYYYNNKIEIPVHSGNIEHRIPKKVFKNPLRIVLNKSMAGKTIEITCVIYGKNLREPLVKKLKIQADL